jgi:methyl-accepting chemotaxis protein
MSISRKSKFGGIAIIAALVLTVIVTSFAIQKIRLGGELYQDDRVANDLIADILPPPSFIVEPWLEVSLIVDNHGSTETHIANLDALRQTYEQRKSYWANQSLPKELKSSFAAAELEADHFWEIYSSEFLPAVRASNKTAFNAAHDKLGKSYEQHRKRIEALVKQATAYKASLDELDHSILNTTITVVSLLALLVIAMVGFAMWFLQGKVLHPVTETAETMTRMAGGDLDAGRISEHRGDEIGDMTRAIEVFRSASIAQREAEVKQRAVVDTMSSALGELAEGNLAHRIETPLAAEYETLRTSFNDTIGRLGELMQRVSSSAQSVSTGAAEIRAASDDLAMRNEQQAASLEETAAAMNQVTGIVKETAAGASDVQRAIGEAHREATEGGMVVQQAVGAMAEIERSASEITQIINVIDGIAFQTNLLALNAGVEAARAGDAGKGFAVVANEVRALAQRSADAAKDIKTLITLSTKQVAGGVERVGETGVLLDKIVTRVGEINHMVGDIAQSTENQATNLTQVNGAVSEMDRMTQQNAAMVEQSTAAARSLADEATQLTELVAQFRTSGSKPQPGIRAISKPRRHAAARSAPVSHGASYGNLALAMDTTGGDDWTEF